MNETPETDALMDVWRVGKLLTVSAMLNHARKLERERDEAWTALREIAAADWKTSGELRGMARKALEAAK